MSSVTGYGFQKRGYLANESRDFKCASSTAGRQEHQRRIWR